MKIIGTGSFLPESIVTNDDLSQIVETSDEWIYSRTGIKQRRISKTEGTTQIAAKAAARAIEDAGISVLDIDMIIVATMSADQALPNCACEVQKAIGATNAFALDLNAACTGFVFALNTTYAYLKSGLCKTALVIGAEVLSKLLNWEDRSTCVLFGDGAGAVVVKASESGHYSFIANSDGSKGDVLTCESRPLINFMTETTVPTPFKGMGMDGQEVFKFAVTKVPESILQVLEKADTPLEDVTYFLLHQANQRIIQSVSKRLNTNIDKFPSNLDRYGNTSAASIPILLDELNQKNLINSGDKLVLSGFGGGLTWGASYLEW